MADLMKRADAAPHRTGPESGPEAEPGPEPEPGTVPGDDRTVRASALARRRRGVLAVASAAALLSLGGLGGAMLVKSPAQAAADTRAPEAGLITASVGSERLARTVVLRGDVTSGATLSVTPTEVANSRALGGGINPGGSSPVLTRKLVHVGDAVRAAKPLVEFSGRPVYVLPGRIPAYRDMLPGESGDDIAQLQGALAGLGLYRGGDRHGCFGTATGKAVVALYHRLGYPVPVTAGSAGKGRGGTTGDPFVPSSELAFVSSVPVRVVGLAASVGDKVSGPVVSLATGGLKLTGYLDPSYQGLVKGGMKVRITSEALGLTAAARVSSVGELVTPGDRAGSRTSGASAQAEDGNPPANGGIPYLPVQVTRVGTWDNRLDGQNVRMTITAATTAGAVLTVPEAAINAGADTRTSVTVAAPDGSQHRVPVTVGVSADGKVQVTPVGTARLQAGDRVVVGQ
ncbi:peptidoglycan-binding protein [Streptomyces sp. me109]|uniref:peptidoglycan-binding protein n=1 Tax=Streptomyces sp. me109 TaxID=1827853 RepID=UPI0011CD8486|nr:peptidoglycan-binding protein [Streptomyces sp. me109]TXS76454.1 peptidoglycan-binding protein [Streptomyces sp. me109]